MNILQRYITRQILFTLIISVAVFSTILLAGDAIKQMLDLFSAGQVPTLLVLKQMLYLVPFALTFSLPMGMMTACLLVFGRLSADNEISAMRACGQSFWQLIAPVLVLGFLLSLVCLWFNMVEAPRLKTVFRNNLARIGVSYPTAFMEQGRFSSELPGYLIYFASREEGRIKDVTIYQLDSRGRVIQKIRAKEGDIQPEVDNRRINIRLHSVRSEVHDPNDPNTPSKIRPGIMAENYELTMDVTQLLDKSKKRDTNLMTFRELVSLIVDLRRMGLKENAYSIYVVRAHKQWVVSFACLAFAMIGIPFGIRAHRRETSIGVAIALGLAFTYYFFVVMAEAFSTKPHMMPEMLIWLPNFAFQI
ncbi:MAG: LptF/LptG family permease, partial [Verrucomicrobiae bacterium]|nr:LptF/LptG family permease [Verrucomicrobiae bacterium]